MNYLNKMYGAKGPQLSNSNKNPNRVLGGLKGAGVDTFTMLGEDGQEKRIPTEAYVRGLEEKIRLQDTRIAVLEQTVRKITNAQRMDRETFTRTNKS